MTRTRTELFMWRIALEDLDRMKAYQQVPHEPHWVTTRNMLNKIEEMKMEAKENHERIIRMRDRFEHLSYDMDAILNTLMSNGEWDLLDKMKLSDDTRRFINHHEARRNVDARNTDT